MVFKHSISAGVGTDMPLFADVCGFEGLPTFPRENATFRNDTLMIFPKCSRQFQIQGVPKENRTFEKIILLSQKLSK
jgi:hypothetical protein